VRQDMSESRATQSFDKRAFIPRRVNAQIVRRYDIGESEIGAGGYGRVFVAEDREILGRHVAIKKVSTARRSKREAFRREVAVMRSLDHPNICKLLETYESEEERSMFLVMEYCDAGDLFECINRDGRHGIPEAECVDIIRQVAGAIKYAHAHGVAHRDLKPENICLIKAGDGTPHVKVIDWGLSAFFNIEGQSRQMHSNVGSPSYVAPEVLQGSRSSGYTERCDLWSFGVLTFVSLTARFPFCAPSADALLHTIRSTTWDKLARSLKECSRECHDFISGLLRMDPAERLTAQQLLEHRWLRRRGTTDMRSVLSNVCRCSSRTFSASFFAALVARQLDHQALRELPKVFLALDTDGNGELDLDEVRRGFEEMFGVDSRELNDIERIFSLLDLDGSGTLDYTEFCAAGLGDRIADEVAPMRAAFKTFDVHDDNGRITRHEFETVLLKAGARAAGEIETEQVFRAFDANGDGELDYQEWEAFVAHHVADGGRQAGGFSRCSTGTPTAASSASEISTTEISGGDADCIEVFI